MTLTYPYARVTISRRFCGPRRSRCTRASSSSFYSIRSSLPFSQENARFYQEAEAAVDVVERACSLCVGVKRTLLASDNRTLEKNDQTPVTIADFSVQALISLELKRLFPSIPLVAEEDSSFLRSGFLSAEEDGHGGNFLVDSVVNAVSDNTTSSHRPINSDDVLNAIDRGGGNDTFSFDAKPATYWVLDPIDGTRGYLKGNDALYVVGLALVVEGKIVLGVMGCPNWKENSLSIKVRDNVLAMSGRGTIMVSHVGCGTWTRMFLKHEGHLAVVEDVWKRCFVDSCRLVEDARFCISDSQTWESIPLSMIFSSTSEAAGVKDEHEIRLIPTCCGSLCKYMMVASGRASVFILRVRVQTLIKAWDHAVGAICVQEAGGQVTDWRGNVLDLAQDRMEHRIIYPSGGVLVSNGNLHKQILEMISSSPVAEYKECT